MTTTLQQYEVDEICDVLMEIDRILADAGFDVDSPVVEGISNALNALGYYGELEDDDEQESDE